MPPRRPGLAACDRIAALSRILCDCADRSGHTPCLRRQGSPGHFTCRSQSSSLPATVPRSAHRRQALWVGFFEEGFGEALPVLPVTCDRPFVERLRVRSVASHVRMVPCVASSDAGRLGHRAAGWMPAKATVWRTGQRAGGSRRTLHAGQPKRRLPLVVLELPRENKKPADCWSRAFAAT